MRRKFSGEYQVGDILEPEEMTSESGEVPRVDLVKLQREEDTLFRVYPDRTSRIWVSFKMRGERHEVPVVFLWWAFLSGAKLALLLGMLGYATYLVACTWLGT